MATVRYRGLLATLFVVSSGVAWGFSASPVRAYEVTITPASPQLGDTLSIRIQSDQPTSSSAPNVKVNDVEYSSFALSDNLFRALVPTSPLDAPGQLVIEVSGEEETRRLSVGLRDRPFRSQSITLSPGSTDLGTDHEFEQVAIFKALVSPERYWQGPLLRPSQGEVSTEYGVQRYYNGVFATDYYHRGVDYAASTGSPVVAPAAGYIRLTGRVADGFELHSNTIGIDHGQGVLSIMLHLSSLGVSEGDFVTAGQVIGQVGSTGASTGPHLHWGLYVNGVSVDPVPWRTEGIQ